MSLTGLQLRDAVLAFWLRFERGPNANDLAAALSVKVDTIRRVVRKSGGGIPDCVTEPGQSQGRGMGSSPTTWKPSVGYLRAMLRQEGTHNSRWRVWGTVHRRGDWSSRRIDHEVIAPTRREAIEQVRATDAAGVAPIVSASYEIEWLGVVDKNAASYELEWLKNC